MSNGPGDQDPEVGTPKRGLSPIVARNQYGGRGDNLGARAGHLPQTSISIFGASAGDWSCGAGCRTYSTSDVQGARRRDTTVAHLLCGQQRDIERDRNASAQGILIRSASTRQAWLTATAGKSAVSSPSIILIAYNLSNCSRPTSCSFQIAYALSPRNHQP